MSQSWRHIEDVSEEGLYNKAYLRKGPSYWLTHRFHHATAILYKGVIIQLTLLLVLRWGCHVHTFGFQVVRQAYKRNSITIPQLLSGPMVGFFQGVLRSGRFTTQSCRLLLTKVSKLGLQNRTENNLFLQKITAGVKGKFRGYVYHITIHRRCIAALLWEIPQEKYI